MRCTPGPWNDMLGVGLFCVEDQHGSLIAGAYWDRSGIMSPHQEEARANIRLIAAAPELLEACRAALDALNELIGADYDVSGEQAKLQAAIAKATGEVGE